MATTNPNFTQMLKPASKRGTKRKASLWEALLARQEPKPETLEEILAVLGEAPRRPSRRV